MSAKPTNLTVEDLESFAKLGISPELLALSGVERVCDEQARAKFGIRFEGDCTGIIFSYVIKRRRVTARLRRDVPDRDAEGKPENKYIAPYGDTRHLYLPPNYEALLADFEIPLLFVESEKAVLAILAWSQRTGAPVLPIGCGGCWGWRGRIGIKSNANGDREEEKGPLPEVAFASDGRRAGILFDANVRTNVKVQQALSALEAQLRKQGAKVDKFALPEMDGVNGPDDFLAIAGDEAFSDLLHGKYTSAITTTINGEGQPDLCQQHASDYGNAQRLIEMYGTKLRYCTPMNKWFIWDGGRWREDKRDQIRELSQNTILEFARQALAVKSATLSRFAGHCLNSKPLGALIREAQPLLAVSPEELDTHPWLLNFLNGTLDLRTLKLMPHDPEHLITKLVHYDYNPQALCPRFLSFIARSAGPLVLFLQKALGYSLTGVTSEKKVFLCLGPTDAGKTTLLTLLREHLFVEYSTLIMIDALMQREEDNNSRADLTDLRGARLAITSETEEGQRLREAKLKRITQGQGKIKSVRKYQNPIEFKETHKLWIDANHQPIVKGTDSAIWNRLVPVPFPNRLAKSEIDRELPDKLLQEAQGIIAWTVRGTQLWLEDGLGQPPEIESARSKWRSEMDRLQAFRDACCVAGPTLMARARPLFKAYKAWSEEANERPITETMFGLRMTEAGIEKGEDMNGRFYRGIALKDLFNG